MSDTYTWSSILSRNMESAVLHFGSAEHLSSHASSSSSPVGFATSFVPPDPPELFYQQFSREEQHEYGNKFVSLMDLNPTFLASDPCLDPDIPCYSPQFSDCAPQDFDVRPFLDSSPDHFPSLQFDDEVYEDSFPSDRKFSSNFTSSPMNASFPQQQQPSYNPRTREIQQDMPVISDEYTGLPSLPLLANPSGGDCVLMNTTQLALYMPLELVYPENCGSTDISSSLSSFHCDFFRFDDPVPLSTSVVGPPSVQTFPQSPNQADLAFSRDPVEAFPPLSVPGLSTPCTCSDCTVSTIPSTVQNNLLSNNFLLASVPAASHNLQTCSTPICNFAVMQSAPTRVSSVRVEGHVDLVGSAIEKFNAETPALDCRRPLEEYRNAQVGSSSASCQDVEGTSVRVHLPDERDRMPVVRRRNHRSLENRCRPLVRPDEAHLPDSEILKAQSISEILRGKEKRTRKTQTLMDPSMASLKDPMLPFRKKRARKSVERKLNEAILIFNNVDCESGDGEETVTEETTAARFLSDSTRETGASSNSKPGLPVRSMTNWTEQKFLHDDFTKKDEAVIQWQQKTSPTLQFPTAVNGSVFTGELPFYSETTFRVQNGSAVERFKHATSPDLSPGEKLGTYTSTSHQNAKVVAGVDYNGTEEQWSSDQGLPFYISNPTTEVHSLSSSANVLVESTIAECNEEFDTEILEDSMDYLSGLDAAVMLQTEANARQVEAEGMRRRDVCSEAILLVQLQSEERAKRSAEEENKTSVCAATANLTVVVGTEGEAELLSQKDDDSPSTPHATSEIITIADRSQRDTQEGRYEKYSPLATVSYVDPTAELMKYGTGADHDSGFLEGSCRNDKSLVPASDFEGLEGRDSAQIGRPNLPRGEAAMGPDPAMKVQPAIHCNVDIDVQCSGAFTCSPIPDSEMELEVSTDRKGSNNSMVENGCNHKRGAPKVHYSKQAPEEKASSSQDLGGIPKETLNAYQEKLMKILTDFIESGYGAGAHFSDNARTRNGDDKLEDTDLSEELSKGTFVLHSKASKMGKGKAQKARWKSISKQQGITGVLEAGNPSSSSHPPAGIWISSGLSQEKTVHRPAPAKIHKTRSRSRAVGDGMEL